MIETLRSAGGHLGLLFMRLSVGWLMLTKHGWGKVANFSERSATFSDPIGIGSTPSLVLAIFAEVVCSLLLMAGAATRLAVIPLIITMLVAAGIVHAADPWPKKELAFMYAIPFITLLLTGAGKYSVDALIGKKKS